MFPCEGDAPVDRAHIVVVLGAAFVGPTPCTAQCEGHAVPSHRYAIHEFLLILRMNLGTLLDCGSDLLLWRQCRKTKIRQTVAIAIAAKQDSGPACEKPGRRITDIGDGLIGVADAAIDIVIFFPEPALELQSNLERRFIRERIDR